VIHQSSDTIKAPVAPIQTIQPIIAKLNHLDLRTRLRLGLRLTVGMLMTVCWNGGRL